MLTDLCMLHSFSVSSLGSCFSISTEQRQVTFRGMCVACICCAVWIQPVGYSVTPHLFLSPLQANFLSIKAKFFAHGLKDVSENTDFYRVMQVFAYVH